MNGLKDGIIENELAANEIHHTNRNTLLFPLRVQTPYQKQKCQIITAYNPAVRQIHVPVPQTSLWPPPEVSAFFVNHQRQISAAEREALLYLQPLHSVHETLLASLTSFALAFYIFCKYFNAKHFIYYKYYT